MQVKDYLQALSDENQIHVEKIGSGNWYWSFLSEEKHARDIVLSDHRKEKARLERGVQELEEQTRQAEDVRGDHDGRAEMIQRAAILEAEVLELRKELGTYKDCDPGELDRKREEFGALKRGAERWTDNIAILETYLRDTLMGGDAAGLDQVRQMVYGSEYIEGEGLRELDFS